MSEKKKSFWSIFVNEEPSVPVQEKQMGATQAAKTVQPAQQMVSGGVINPSIFQALKETVSAKNLPGPDYLELKQTALSMANVILDETTRFQAAYSALKAGNPGLTRLTILDSIDKYVAIVEDERASGLGELETMVKETVDTRLNKAAQISRSIEEKTKMIQQLQEEIVVVNQELNTLNAEIVTKRSEIDAQRNNFIVSVDAMVKELQDDKTKLSTLIVE